jgi:hypothetical protein
MKSTVIIILSYIIVYNNIYIVALSPVRFLYTRTGISPKDTIIIILYIITKKKHRVKKKNCVGMEYNIRYIYSYYTRRFTEVYVGSLDVKFYFSARFFGIVDGIRRGCHTTIKIRWYVVAAIEYYIILNIIIIYKNPHKV